MSYKPNSSYHSHSKNTSSHDAIIKFNPENKQHNTSTLLSVNIDCAKSLLTISDREPFMNKNTERLSYDNKPFLRKLSNPFENMHQPDIDKPQRPIPPSPESKSIFKLNKYKDSSKYTFDTNNHPLSNVSQNHENNKRSSSCSPNIHKSPHDINMKINRENIAFDRDQTIYDKFEKSCGVHTNSGEKCAHIKIDIQNLDSSPYSVKKIYKIGNNNKYIMYNTTSKTSENVIPVKFYKINSTSQVLGHNEHDNNRTRNKDNDIYNNSNNDNDTTTITTTSTTTTTNTSTTTTTTTTTTNNNTNNNNNINNDNNKDNNNNNDNNNIIINNNNNNNNNNSNNNNKSSKNTTNNDYNDDIIHVKKLEHQNYPDNRNSGNIENKKLSTQTINILAENDFYFPQTDYSSKASINQLLCNDSIAYQNSFSPSVLRPKSYDIRSLSKNDNPLYHNSNSPKYLKSISDKSEMSKSEIAPYLAKLSPHPSPIQSDILSNPSVADVEKYGLVQKLSYQFEKRDHLGSIFPVCTSSNSFLGSKYRIDSIIYSQSETSCETANSPIQTCKMNETPFEYSYDSSNSFSDYIFIDRHRYDRIPTSPQDSYSLTELEFVKSNLRRVKSNENMNSADESLTSSSSTSVFIQDMSLQDTMKVPDTPNARRHQKAWDQVNKAFSFAKSRSSPGNKKNLYPNTVLQEKPIPDEDDVGGKILVRSKRPAYEIFRESVRIKKRERARLESMYSDDLFKMKTSILCDENMTSDTKLFDFVLVVCLEEVKGTYQPKINYRFPPSNYQEDIQHCKSLLDSVPHFCFPDASLWKPSMVAASHNHLSETYSFLLTDELGEKRFGYCRRIVPKGKTLPEVYCIISPLGCFSLYSSILDHVEARRAHNSSLVFAFLKSVISHPLPHPGQSVNVKSLSDSCTGIQDIELVRPSDSSRPEHVNFSKLFCCLGLKLTLQVFASLLLERRLIFVSEHLSRLSSCCYAIVALLYPFSWQHVYIPVLPSHMVHICCSPAPFIVGILPTCLQTVLDFGEEMEETLIVSLEEKKLILSAGDEDMLLPNKLYLTLESILKGCDEKETWKKTPEMDDVITEAFIRFFIEILDNYREFTIHNETDPTIIEFNSKPFLKTVKSKASKRFLTEFCKTQMFFNFLQEQGDNPKFSQCIKSLFKDRYDEIMSNKVLSAKYGKQIIHSNFLKKLKFSKH